MKELDIRIRNGGDDAIAAVSELMPQWIPVTERLPERNERVIVVDESGVNGGSYSPMLDDWWSLKWFSGDYEVLVSHWMPFPAPPQTDK